MKNTYELDQKIKELLKNNDYKGAIKVFKDSYKSGEITKDDIRKNNYLMGDLIKSYRKAGLVEKAFEFIKHIEIDPIENKFLHNDYGWLLYDKYKMSTDGIDEHADDRELDVLTAIEDENIFSPESSDNYSNEIIEYAYKLLPLLDKSSKYSPFSKLFRISLKTETHRNKPNWNKIQNILECIDKNSLSLECETFEREIKGKKKIIETASDKETWYAYQSKVLLKQGKYEECFNLSKEALSTFTKYHYNNDIWFARRIALCKKELGDIDTAIKDLEIILQRKNDWFIQAELAELYYDSQKYLEALKYACHAAQNYGDTEYKIGLFYNMSRIFEALGENNYAYLHVLLVKMIKIGQDWKIGPEINERIDKYKSYGGDKIYSDVKQLYDELAKVWKEKYPLQNNKPSDKKIKGKIKSIKRDREFGFINGEDHKDYYFRFNNVKGDVNKINEGLEVRFRIKSSIQEGKNPIAVDIEIL